MKVRDVLWRSVYTLTNPFRYAYWRVFKPKTRGVKCLVEYEGTFLLVRLAYNHKQWTFPGGGVHRKESYEQAAVRELFEETGVSVSQLMYIGEFSSCMQHKQDTVACFYAKVASPKTLMDTLEIADIGWFKRAELPLSTRPVVQTIFGLYDKWREDYEG